MIYLYDANGSPIGMQYRTTSYAEGVFDTYWFEKNLQGDIVAVYNDAGTLLATYAYDAWGGIASLRYSNGGSSTAAQYNPFRYRGYYRDSETGFYYLNSRYYDPNTGRFINADGQLNTSLGILGCNQYAYCINSPINIVDYCGNKPGDLFNSIDAAARDFAVYINKKSIEDNREYASYIYKVTCWEERTYVNPNIFGNSMLSWFWNYIFGGSVTKTVKVKVTKYTYREPKRGTADSSSPPINWFGMHKIVGRLHTHAAYDPKYDNDVFSSADKRNAKRQKIPTYVATPLGTLRKYDPADNTDIVLYNDIPYDPNHPGR